MYRQLSDERYVHSALFKDEKEARAAMHSVEDAGLSSERVALALLHEDKAIEAASRPFEGDGQQCLLLGLLIGAIVGFLMSLVIARLSILSGFFEQTAMFGLFGGMMLGGLGGGFYGMGLLAAAPPQSKPLGVQGNCLLTAKAIDLPTILQVETIFKKHHALAATR